MSVYNELIEESEDIVLDEATLDSLEGLLKKISDSASMKMFWAKMQKEFVKHKHIINYVNDKQKEQLKKSYSILQKENVSYYEYKKSFNSIAKFFGLDPNKIMIENITFKRDRDDKEQSICDLQYSKGLIKVRIPDSVHLIHISPANNIDALEPSFRSRQVGKYLYPNKRCFFTVNKEVPKNKAGLSGQKTTKYIVDKKIEYAYIDPSCSDFMSGAVYIPTDSPIPVKKVK